MKGSNKLHINQATMQAAMQQYLDSILVPAAQVNVKNVEKDASTSGFGCDHFIVTVDEAETLLRTAAEVTEAAQRR